MVGGILSLNGELYTGGEYNLLPLIVVLERMLSLEMRFPEAKQGTTQVETLLPSRGLRRKARSLRIRSWHTVEACAPSCDTRHDPKTEMLLSE